MTLVGPSVLTILIMVIYNIADMFFIGMLETMIRWPL